MDFKSHLIVILEKVFNLKKCFRKKIKYFKKFLSRDKEKRHLYT